MDAKRDFNYVHAEADIDWETANLRVWVDGGSRAAEKTSASAYLIKIADAKHPKLRILAAGSKFHFAPATASLAIEAEAMKTAWEMVRHFDNKHVRFEESFVKNSKRVRFDDCFVKSYCP
eukprot:7436984-Karenia_brevis.AAC.1